MNQVPFSHKYPAYMTQEAQAACLAASRQHRAVILRRREARIVQSAIEDGLAKIQRGAKVIAFPMGAGK